MSVHELSNSRYDILGGKCNGDLGYNRRIWQYIQHIKRGLGRMIFWLVNVISVSKQSDIRNGAQSLFSAPESNVKSLFVSISHFRLLLRTTWLILIFLRGKIFLLHYKRRWFSKRRATKMVQDRSHNVLEGLWQTSLHLDEYSENLNVLQWPKGMLNAVLSLLVKGFDILYCQICMSSCLYAYCLPK